jgi:hypothetical protein
VAAFSGDLAFINLINAIAFASEDYESDRKKGKRRLVRKFCSLLPASPSPIRARWPIAATGLLVLLAPAAAASQDNGAPFQVAQATAAKEKPTAKSKHRAKTDSKSE